MKRVRSCHRLVYHQRSPGPGGVSIERLFDEIRTHFSPRWEPEIAICPYVSQGMIPRVRNMVAARARAGLVNHIVGDVHYLALSLPRDGLVLTIHDCATLNRLSGMAQEVFRQLWFVRPIARARVVTVISNTMRAELGRWVGVLADRVRVVPNCVRSEFVPSPKEFNREEPVILQVGTGWNKNLERVTYALKGIKCRLDIIGDLSEEQKRALASTSVKYRAFGRISHDEVLAAYQRCDVVVFASTYEGFGLPILEAQAVGRPIITSNCGAMAEAAGAGALLVNPFDVDSLRTGIIDAITSEYLRERTIERGFQNIKRFLPQTIAAAYTSIYEEVLR